MIKACLRGDGGPQIGEISLCGGSPYLSCKHVQIKMGAVYRQVGYPTYLKHVTSPTWGPQTSM